MRKQDQFAKDSGAWCNLNKPELSEEEVDAVIFGIPFDEGVSYRGGAGEAPSMLRQNTFTSTAYTERFADFSKFQVYDAGDFQGGSREELFAEIERYTAELVEKGIFFTVVGGDHSVTIPLEAGVNQGVKEQFGIIHIDAHSDLCDDMDGDKLSHGCVQRRALELSNVAGPENLYFIGIRSIEPDEHALRGEMMEKGTPLQIATAYDCHKKGIEAVAADVVEKMSKFSKIYLTFDIDALDPAYAAGTGTPQFGGLSSRDVLTLLEVLFTKLNIIAFDVVEVAPPLDPSLTAMYAARKIIQECWGYQAKKIGKLEE